MKALVVAVALAAFASGQAPAPPAQASKSALESEPKGWMDVLGGKGLDEWTRVPMGPVGQLPAGKPGDPSPWRIEGGVLVCDGAKAGHEMLRYLPELGDFVLHVEWRFTPIPVTGATTAQNGQPGYNSGVFVKTSADGSQWFQAQTGAAGGYLFGTLRASDKPVRVNLRDKMTENRVKPAGEWNTYEIRAAGKALALWVNGAMVNEYTECEVPRGFIGFEAEGYRIEFRNVKLKAAR